MNGKASGSLLFLLSQVCWFGFLLFSGIAAGGAAAGSWVVAGVGAAVAVTAALVQVRFVWPRTKGEEK